jgi:hypothetical protein
MPSFSAKLYEILNVKYDEEASKLLKKINDYFTDNPENPHLFLIKLPLIEEGKTINNPLPLFKTSNFFDLFYLVTEEEVAEFKKIYG